MYDNFDRLEFNDLRNQIRKQEQIVSKLQADLHNSYREYQHLSEKAYRMAAEQMRKACIAQAVALAKAGAPPEQFEKVLSQIPINPAQEEAFLKDIHES